MTDLVERLRGTATSLAWTASSDGNLVGLALEAAAEIERLRELLRSEGANRYWEGRWRDEVAANDQLRKDAKEYLEWFKKKVTVPAIRKWQP